MYTYFVAYIVVDPKTGQHAFGNCEVKAPHKITSHQDIVDIEKEFKENDDYIYTIQSFQLLAGDESC